MSKAAEMNFLLLLFRKKSFLLFLFFLSLFISYQLKAQLRKESVSGGQNQSSPAITVNVYSEAEKIFSEKFDINKIKIEFIKYNSIPNEYRKDFIRYAQHEQLKDRNKFFDEYAHGKIKSGEIPSYFSNLKAKYLNLYKVYQAELQSGSQTQDLSKGSNDDDFSLSYKKGVGGTDSTMQLNGPCVNMDFEDGTTNGWTGYTGSFGNPTATVGIVNGRHTIMTAGFDPIVGGTLLPTVNPAGGTYSLRLGDSNVGAQSEAIEQSFLVSANNTNFTYYFAVVFQDPQHPPNQQPYFEVHMYDLSNNSLIACADYTVKSGSGIPGFLAVPGSANSEWYRPWTASYIPLGAYIGKNVKVEFITADCSQGGHFGYAYIDATCAPLQIVSSSPVVCGGSSVNLTAPPGATVYNWSTGGNTQTITINTGGTYTVTCTAASGCSNVLSITVPSNPTIPTPNFTSTTVCVGNPTVFTDASTVSSGTITGWRWDFGDASVTNDTSLIQSTSWTYASPGTYNVTLTVTTSVGCVADTILPVTVIGSFNPLFAPDTLCDNEPPVTLVAASPGGTWSGTGITNTSTGTFNPATAGIGSWPVTYSGGSGACVSSHTETMIVAGVAINNVSSANVTCFGLSDGTITINATGAAQFSIDNGSTFQATGNFTGLSAGTYPIVVISAINNCQKTSSATISEPPQLIMAFQAFNVNCFNACDGYAVVIPAGGTPQYTYTWSPAVGNIATSTGLCNGSYSLTVKDNNNCSIDTNFAIIQPPDYSIVTSAVSSNCGHPDGSAMVISVSGQTPGYTYLWSDPASQSTDTATALINGTYNVTITDTKNCDTVLSVVVGYVPPPSASASSTPATCYDSCNGTATVVGNGGTTPGNYTYLWNDAQSTSAANGLCAGSYTVTVSDGNQCKGFTSVVVQQPTQVTVVPYKDTIICISTPGTVGGTAMGGNGAPYTYTWDILPQGSPQAVSNLSSTTCYTVTATDVNGCPSTPQTQCISLYPPLMVLAGGTPIICQGNSADISAFATGGKGGPYSYTWTGGLTGSAQTVFPPGSNPNTVTYIVTATDACPQTASDSVVISFYPQPVANFSADTTFVCVPYAIIFSRDTTSPSVSCLWTISDGSVISDCDSFVHLFSNVGKYDVTLTIVSPNGCVDTKTIPKMITVNPNPVADFSFTPQPTDVQNMSIRFTDMSLGSVNQWEWGFYDNDGSTQVGSSGIQNPSHNFATEPDNPFIFYLTDTGNYPVTLWVKTMDGCVDSVTKDVRVDGVFYVNVPNAFTPNGDGINDKFFPSGVGIQPSTNYRFLIFNRWGDIIFESKALDDPWDGTARSLGGKDIVQQGVYVWKLELQDVTRDQEKHHYIGHVTLLR